MKAKKPTTKGLLLGKALRYSKKASEPVSSPVSRSQMVALLMDAWRSGYQNGYSAALQRWRSSV